MGRIVAAVIAGLVAWLAMGTIAGFTLRALWPAYVAAEPSFAFTLPMQLARLAIGAVSTIAAGWIAARIGRGERRAALTLGVVLLLLFIPNHYYLRDKFPLWYHLLFLSSLVPLTLLGGAISRRTA